MQKILTKAAKNNLDSREEEMAKVEDKWERDLDLIGATAIEDRLQDQVRNINSTS